MVGADIGKDVVMGDQRDLLADGQAGDADCPHGAQRRHHRAGDDGSRRVFQLQKALRQPEAHLVGEFAMPAECGVRRDAAGAERRLIAILPVLGKDAAAIAVEQRDAAMAEIEQVAGRLANRAEIVDIQPAEIAVGIGASMHDEGQAQRIEQRDARIVEKGECKMTASTRLLAARRR